MADLMAVCEQRVKPERRLWSEKCKSSRGSLAVVAVRRTRRSGTLPCAGIARLERVLVISRI